MSLYPSLEDMKVDQLTRAQQAYDHQVASYATPTVQSQLPYPLIHQAMPNAPVEHANQLYPELNEYMGLELTEEMMLRNRQDLAVAIAHPSSVVEQVRSGPVSGMVAPISGQSVGLLRAQVTHGIRELTICKDASGKVGVRVQAINNGVFVCLVSKASPAALAGLRFGDQILQVNGTVVAGFTMDKVHDLFRKSPVNGINVIVRDRPFERTVTLHKDSTGHIGFSFKNGAIISLVKDSSAARNGLLTEHHLLEVNGQNVVGIKDKEITSIIEQSDAVVTITVIPTFVYEHMVKKMNVSLLRGSMDHSIPV